jgi:hypothetical protein
MNVDTGSRAVEITETQKHLFTLITRNVFKIRGLKSSTVNDGRLRPRLGQLVGKAGWKKAKSPSTVFSLVTLFSSERA